MKTRDWSLLIIGVGAVFALLGTPLIVSSSLLFPYISGKAFFFRVLVELAVVAWAWLAIWRPEYRLRRATLLWVLAIWVAWLGLAAFLGANPYHSFWSNFERMEGVVTYLHLLAFFIILVSLFKTEKIWWRLWHVSLGVSVVVGLIGVWQWLSGEAQGGRADATFGNPIYLAVYALIHLFISLFYLAGAKSRGGRIGYSLLALFELVILYLTGTRGALVGLLVGLVVGALYVAIRGVRSRGRRIALAGLIVLAVLIGGFWTMRQSQFVQSNSVLSRFANISLSDNTTRHRLLVWGESWQGFKEHPIFGWGAENFHLVFAKYFNPGLYNAEPWFDRSHNILLDWLVTAGVLGLAGYLALFGLAIVYVWRDREWSAMQKAGWLGLLVAYLIQNIFVFDNLMSYVLFVMILGYLHNRQVVERSLTEVKNERSYLGRKVLAVLAFIGFWPVLYFVVLQPLWAGQALVRALQSPDSTSAIKCFIEAYRYNTFADSEINDQLLNRLNGILQDKTLSAEARQSFLSLAESRFLALTERQPADTRAQSNLASFYTQNNQLDKTIATLERAVALAPAKQQFHNQLAVALFAAGRRAEAERVAKAALGIEPRNAETRRIYALILLSEKRATEANQLLGWIDPTTGQPVELDDRFARAFEALGDHQRVLKIVMARAAAAPADLQIQTNLAAAYLKAGQRAQAIAALEHALTLTTDATRPEINFYLNEIRAGRDPSAH